VGFNEAEGWQADSYGEAARDPLKYIVTPAGLSILYSAHPLSHRCSGGTHSLESPLILPRGGTSSEGWKDSIEGSSREAQNLCGIRVLREFIR